MTLSFDATWLVRRLLMLFRQALRSTKRFVRQFVKIFIPVPQQPSRSTVFHEAGHAVAAVALGILLKLVSVRSDRDIFGRIVLTENWPHHRPGFNPRDPQDRLIAEKWIILSLAGEAADAHSTGREPNPDTLGPMGDTGHARELCRLLFDRPGERVAFLKSMQVRTHQLVTDPLRWRQITAVAEELRRLGELDNEQVARIMEDIARGQAHEEPG